MVEEGDGTGGVAGRPAGPGRAPRKGRPFKLEPLAGETQRPLACRPASPSSTASPAAASCAARCCWSAAIPASANRPCCCRPRRRSPARGHRAVYISGEEAVAQVRLRAERLGLGDAPVELAAETSVEDIVATLSEGKTPRLVVIDSIQTMWTDAVESAPGHRHPGARLGAGADPLRQEAGAAVILVGHVTKDGQIAGPRVVEHMVDAVLSFEGDGAAPVPHPARGEEPLRPDRRDRRVRDDRRGPARGRQPVRAVPRPSATAARPAPRCSPASRAPGRCWSRSRRWSRRPRSARRAAPWSAGIPAGWRWCWRCCEARCGVSLGGHDVYLNVAGGLRIVEPAADLAVAAALVSSLANAPLPADAVYFGEVALSGAVRPVAQAAARLKEAQKLGFARAVVPEAGGTDATMSGLALNPVGNLVGLVSDIAARGEKAPQESAPARSRRRVTEPPRAAIPAALWHQPGQDLLQQDAKNDTKLNHWADCQRPLPCSVRASECGSKTDPDSPDRRPASPPRSPATLSEPCRSRGSIFSCSASC